jgi:hypothetical protein
MIESTVEQTIAAIHALRAAGSTEMALSDSDRERAAMKIKMNKARDVENMKDDPVWFKQHREDTKYKQWQDGMYVMLDDLDGDYELALVENSLRDSVYFRSTSLSGGENCMGVLFGDADYYCACVVFETKLTRAQALYIATGDADI